MKKEKFRFVKALYDSEFIENYKIERKKNPKEKKQRFSGWNLAFFATGCIALVVFLVAEAFGDQGKIAPFRPWLMLIPSIGWFVGLMPPVVRLAISDRHYAMKYVASWAAAAMCLLIFTWYAVFFAFVPVDSPNFEAFSRLLNVPPAILAIFGAGLGWYVTYQSSMKTHRTNNAFALVQQTRTSAEYLKHLRAFQVIYPPGCNMTDADRPYFDRNKVRELPGLYEDFKELECARSSDNRIDRRKLTEEISRIEAVLSAKYLLNFYEFMAYAIEVGDLDEDILYETISPTVTGIYSRTMAFRKYMQEIEDPLVMEHLGNLVNAWKELGERVNAKKILNGNKQ